MHGMRDRDTHDDAAGDDGGLEAPDIRKQRGDQIRRVLPEGNDRANREGRRGVGRAQARRVAGATVSHADDDRIPAEDDSGATSVEVDVQVGDVWWKKDVPVSRTRPDARLDVTDWHRTRQDGLRVTFLNGLGGRGAMSGRALQAGYRRVSRTGENGVTI